MPGKQDLALSKHSLPETFGSQMQLHQKTLLWWRESAFLLLPTRLTYLQLHHLESFYSWGFDAYAIKKPSESENMQWIHSTVLANIESSFHKKSAVDGKLSSYKNSIFFFFFLINKYIIVLQRGAKNSILVHLKFDLRSSWSKELGFWNLK